MSHTRFSAAPVHLPLRSPEKSVYSRHRISRTIRVVDEGSFRPASLISVWQVPF